MAQRIYSAYRYYLHQVENNPILKEWYHQKLQVLEGKDVDPGPRPGAAPRGLNNYYGSGRGGGGGGVKVLAKPRKDHVRVIDEVPPAIGPTLTDSESDDALQGNEEGQS